MKRILYISYMLPSVTTTFVYREIQALKDAGYQIKTVSMSRPVKSHLSVEALPFYESTLYLDQVSLLGKLFSQVKILFAKPLAWLQLIWIALREKEIKDSKDRVRILYHFIEAGYLYTKIMNESFDHIHASFLSGPTTIALFLSQYLAIPYSFTMHASNIFIDPIMLGTKLRYCKKAVTISQYNKQYLIKKYGTHFEGKIPIIHYGIDVAIFCPNRKAKGTPPMILSVGQFAARKGFSYLLEACSLLKKKETSFQCVIVGDGKEREPLMEKARSLGVCDVVTFLGRQPQEKIRELLSIATIFTLPSIVTDAGGREGIPNALIEAMAMELPVVSTRTVGIPELIEHQKEGILVEQRNSAELASALENLLLNQEIRIAMGCAARARVVKEFNLANIPDQFNDIFY